jgi:hypothetical protein
LGLQKLSEAIRFLCVRVAVGRGVVVRVLPRRVESRKRVEEMLILVAFSLAITVFVTYEAASK